MNELSPNLQSIIDGLNPAQKEATLNTVGPELIIAGAGSGKTKVLTTRIALLMEQGILPERILALTFTKKAADEMKQRICAIEGKAAKKLRMGTFHSVFITFLRPYAHYLNFRENFTILDEDDSLSCLKRCISQVLGAGRPPVEQQTKEHIARFKKIDRDYRPKTIINIISSCKNRLITADEYCADEDNYRRDARNSRPKTGEIFKLYRDTCFRMNMMDFDDILLYTDMLLANYPQVCMEIASNFDYILVDEYQDTNAAQYSILNRLTYKNKNICVVGDDSQSIYAFRGAMIQNILNFNNDFPNSKIIRLEQNYRSTRTIVDAANRLIENNDTRIPKNCFSNAEEGEKITFRECRNEKYEADYIASVISTLIRRDGYKHSDFAVLYRTNSQSRAFEDSLIRHRIPYTIYSGTSFFDRMEIKDMMAYFKLCVNPDDDESLRRIINKPIRSIGNIAMGKICEHAMMLKTSLWKAINDKGILNVGLSPRSLEGLSEFRKLISEGIEYAQTKTAFETAYVLSNKVGFYSEYKNDTDEDSQRRADNLRELVDSVKSYEEDLTGENADLKQEEKKASTLAGFLQNVMLLTNADTGESGGDKVSLMTVHCSKGLEFTCVFVTGMEIGLFPLCIEGTLAEEEEERRLFYVAVTRAKKLLYLTKADQRLRNGKRTYQENSYFVGELLDNNIGFEEDDEEDE